MIEVRFHFGHLDRLPRCDHTKLATIFCSCPVCQCILNSTQAVRDRHDGDLSGTPAAVSTFHKDLNSLGGANNNVA